MSAESVFKCLPLEDETFSHFVFHDQDDAYVKLRFGVPVELRGVQRVGTEKVVKPLLQINSIWLTISGGGRVVMDAAGCLKGEEGTTFHVNDNTVYVHEPSRQIEICGELYEFATKEPQYTSIQLLSELEMLQVFSGVSLRIEKPDCVQHLLSSGNNSNVTLAADQKKLCHVATSLAAGVTAERDVKVGAEKLVLAAFSGLIHIKGEVTTEWVQVRVSRNGSVILGAAQENADGRRE